MTALLSEKARTTMWVSLDEQHTLIADMTEDHAKNALALIVYNLRRGGICMENPETGAIKFQMPVVK